MPAAGKEELIIRPQARHLALLTLALVLALPLAGAGQGKVKDIPAAVTFRNAAGDMIRGDEVSATITSSGNLYVADNDESGHRIQISFNSAVVLPPAPYNCKAWGPIEFTWQLSPASDLSTPRLIQIWTFYQYEYDAAHGWAPIMDPSKRGSTTTTEDALDIRKDVPPGETRYVGVLIRLFVSSTSDLYELWMNREWPTTSGFAGGIFDVKASPDNAAAPGAAGDVFTLRPLVSGQPYPLPGLGQNEALLRATDYADSSKDTSGPCHMGTYLMPFQMVVTCR